MAQNHKMMKTKKHERVYSTSFLCRWIGSDWQWLAYSFPTHQGFTYSMFSNFASGVDKNHLQEMLGPFFAENLTLTPSDSGGFLQVPFPENLHPGSRGRVGRAPLQMQFLPFKKIWMMQTMKRNCMDLLSFNSPLDKHTHITHPFCWGWLLVREKQIQSLSLWSNFKCQSSKPTTGRRDQVEMSTGLTFDVHQGYTQVRLRQIQEETFDVGIVPVKSCSIQL